VSVYSEIRELQLTRVDSALCRVSGCVISARFPIVALGGDERVEARGNST